jgi:hypothetical protein
LITTLANLRANHHAPYIAVFLASLLLSLVAIATDAIINNDGVYYLDAAAVANEYGVLASFKAFNWPFFSWLIAGLQRLSGLSYEISGFVLSMLLLAGACVAFLRLYWKISDGSGSLWLAAFVVLAASGVNGFRSDIMRDFGHWLFFLLAMLSLFAYLDRPTWRGAIAWQVFCVLGFLFRVEVVVLMLAIPFAVFFRSDALTQRFWQWLSLYSLYLFALVAVALGFLGGLLELPRDFSTKASGVIQYAQPEQFFDAFNRAVGALGGLFFYDGAHPGRFVASMSVVTALTILSYVVVRVVSFFGLPYAAILAYGVHRGYLAGSRFNATLYFYLAVLLGFFFVYTVQHPVLMGRYTATMTFVLMLLLTSVVERGLPGLLQKRRGRRLVWFIGAVLLLSVLDDVISSPSKSKEYLKATGAWVEANVPPAEPVYSNSLKTLYFAQRRFLRQHELEHDELVSWLERNGGRSDAWVVVYFKRGTNEAYRHALDRLQAAQQAAFQTAFENKKGDRTEIYRLIASPAS